MYRGAKNDPVYSLDRLNKILASRRLVFNPYKVSDRRLMEIVSTTGWGNEFDLVQITSVSFTRLREMPGSRGFDGIYMLNATDPDEIFIPLGALVWPVTARDTLRQTRSIVGKRPIRNEDDVESLVGKRFFVSRIIRGENPYGSYKSAYRFHRIKGNIAKDAAMIREAMCAAKIEMLRRLLDNPQCADYLNCNKGLFEFEPRILRAIDIITHYSDFPVPSD